MLGGSFIALLAITGFLASAWTATKVSRLAGVSSIALEIGTGLVLGPSVLKLLDPEYAECQHARRIDCTPPPNFHQLVRQGKPLPGGLGMIEEMDICPRDLYEDGRGRFAVELEEDEEEEDIEEEMDMEVEDFGYNGTENATLEEAPEVNAVEGEAAGRMEGENGTFIEVEDAEDTVEEEEDDDDDFSASLAHQLLADEMRYQEGRRLGRAREYPSYQECLIDNCLKQVRKRCEETPGFFTLVGQMGVSLKVFESGMHVDFNKVLDRGATGQRAWAAAGLGIFLPFITGALMTMIYGRPFAPDGVAVGAALAPTSGATALRFLADAKVLTEDFGQIIHAASIADTLISLTLFDFIINLRDGFDVMETLVSPVIGIAVMGVSVAGALRFWPKFLNEVVLPKVPNMEGAKISGADQALFAIMMSVLIAFATVTFYLGTHIWGCFIAGISFACLDHAQNAWGVWLRQTKRATAWMLRMFYAATVAFSIPVLSLLTFEAFWKGTLLGIIPCVLMKAVSGVFLGQSRFVVGCAMVARAELAYLFGHMSYSAGMMDEETYSALIWALLYATIFAPFLFRRVLTGYVDQHCKGAAQQQELKDAEEARKGVDKRKEVDVLGNRN